MSTTKAPFEEFEIHSLDHHGVEVVVRAETPFTSESRVVYPGDSIVITEAIRELNVDRNGNSWLDFSTEQQRKVWNTPRFGRGPVPEVVAIAAAEGLRARLNAELDHVRQTNATVLISSGAQLRADAISAKIDAVNSRIDALHADA